MQSAKTVLVVLLCAGAQLTLKGFFFHDYLGLPTEKLSVVARLYQRILTAGYRPTIPRSCTIVTLAARDAHESVCGVRSRLHDAVQKILRYRPRGVMAIATLQDGIACPNRETEELIKAAQAACFSPRGDHSVTPIVFGHDFTYQGQQAVRLAGLSIVPLGQDSKCGIGHTSPERDFRLLPLEMNALGQWYPSLSLKAAELIDEPTVLKNRAVASSLRSHSSLYTSLFLEKDFEKYTVNEGELFSPNVSIDLDDRLRARVAVIGFEGERPVTTNIGPVPGHVLHAAYLEAFLDGRALSEISAWIYWPIAVVFWAVVEFIQQTRGIWFGLGTIACGFGFLLVLTLLLVNFAGYYSDFPTISLAGLFVWISNAISRLGH